MTVLLLLVIAAGCGSTQDAVQTGSQEGAGSPGDTEPQKTVQGTTSKGSTQEAESTVGIVQPEEPTAQEPTAQERSSQQAAAPEAVAEDASPASSGELTTTGAPAPPETSSEPAAGSAGKDSQAAVTSASRTSQKETGSEPQAAPDYGEFVASPEDSGGNGYMADSILGVRFGDHEGYERVVVDLGSGGQPTSGIPNWTLSSPTGDGRLKLILPSVRNTAVSDGSLENAGAELLDSFYVVRGPEGGMFVDFFAERAFYYRVVELPDPSRIAVDFKSAGSDLAIPLPVRGGNTVLTQPRRDTGVTSPMIVSGYSRNPEASNTIVLQGPGGTTLAQQTALSNDWSSTWGYFETSLDFQPFDGEGVLKVGTQSARDGSFEGVELPVKNAG